ncbi:MAG: hypothetical protein K8R21_10225 [Leptospira sp.]|nr:hypothetical protein [Leptospira sp.]
MENNKNHFKRAEISEKINELLNRKHFNFEIRGLTRDTRDLISLFINGVMERLDANPLSSFHLFSGLMEALLNALKGNIRYVIFKDELLKKIAEEKSYSEEAEQLLGVILDTAPLRESIQRYIVPDKIKKTVQKILTLEDKVRVKKKELTEEERQFFKSVREKIKKEDLKIAMKIQITDDELLIRIRNDAPVMSSDLKRIEETRIKHYELYKEGNSSDFFRPEYLDEKESAGFGIAMIDEGYYSMGINPLEYFTITTGSKVTTVYMRYPIEALKLNISD